VFAGSALRARAAKLQRRISGARSASHGSSSFALLAGEAVPPRHLLPAAPTAERGGGRDSACETRFCDDSPPTTTIQSEAPRGLPRRGPGEARGARVGDSHPSEARGAPGGGTKETLIRRGGGGGGPAARGPPPTTMGGRLGGRPAGASTNKNIPRTPVPPPPPTPYHPTESSSSARSAANAAAPSTRWPDSLHARSLNAGRPAPLPPPLPRPSEWSVPHETGSAE
jgi:hypothetical protein